MIINKSWFHTGICGIFLTGPIARLKNAVKIEIPVGYQDEAGFHNGVKADEKRIKWPTVW